jgi:hypothetical protein
MFQVNLLEQILPIPEMHLRHPASWYVTVNPPVEEIMEVLVAAFRVEDLVYIPFG